MSDKTPASKLVQGTPFGAVYPGRAAVDLPALDGRTAALRILARYIAELTFRVPGPPGTVPSALRLPPTNIHVEQPDNVQNLKAPSIVFVPGAGEYLPVGLSTFLEEASKDRFARGTALQVQSEYQETFTIECWAKDKPSRRSMVAGLEAALVPTEQMYGIRFRMPDYYDQTVYFSLATSMRPDDPDAVRNRRWAHLGVEMRFDVVRLVNVDAIVPEVAVEAYDVVLPFSVPLKTS